MLANRVTPNRPDRSSGDREREPEWYQVRLDERAGFVETQKDLVELDGTDRGYQPNEALGPSHLALLPAVTRPPGPLR